MKTNSPFDASFKRSLDAYGAWLYTDPSVHSACVAWLMAHQFNLADFDNFLQEDSWDVSFRAKENRELLIQRRADALQAFKAGNRELAYAWLNFLHVSMYANKRESFLLPLSRTGKKFVAGRKQGAVGPVRAAVRRYLQRQPDANTAQIWAALKAKPPKGMVFYDNRLGKYIETEGYKDTSYRLFTNMVSAERKYQEIKRS
jgi:hypothetical protein